MTSVRVVWSPSQRCWLALLLHGTDLVKLAAPQESPMAALDEACAHFGVGSEAVEVVP